MSRSTNNSNIGIEAKRTLIDLWWWSSIPYTLLFAVLVLVLRPSPGILSHVILPLLDLFELTLWSSISWIVVSFAMIIVRTRSSALTLRDKGMLATGIASCIAGVYLELQG